MDKVNKSEEELVTLLRYLNEQHERQCKPYIEALIKLRSNLIDPLFIKRDLIFWDNPDLSYERGEL